MTEYYLGADPGGKGNFGLAFLERSGDVLSLRVSSIDEAVNKICEILQPADKLLGLGIDAPMWWSSRIAGSRKADEIILNKFSNAEDKRTVQKINSLKGAVLIGGAMLAYRVKQKFPNINITESHPKALLIDLKIDRSSFPKKYRISTTGWSNNEDEQDATIAAVCAREGFEGRWTTDYAEKRYRHHPSEQDPKTYWLAPMYYFWPSEEKIHK